MSRRPSGPPRCFPTILVLLLTVVTAPAAAGPLRSRTLPNGLQVVVRHDPALRTARVAMVYACGRATDPDSLAGLAHLAEHLLTESSAARPDGGLIREATLWSTYRNAYTRSVAMGFDTVCLPAYLPRVLALEAERWEPAPMAPAVFARERAVVLQELDYRRQAPPFPEHVENVLRACYAGHPIGSPVAGSSRTVGRITRDDIERFRADHIRPSRAALVVSGPLDPARVLALVDSLLAGGPRAAPTELQLPAYPPPRPDRAVFDSDAFEGVRVTAACRVPVDAAGRLSVIFSGVVLRELLATAGFGFSVRAVPDERVVMLHTWWRYSRPPRDPQLHYGYTYERFDPDQTARRALGALWDRLARELQALADPGTWRTRRAKAVAVAGAFDAGDEFGIGSSLVNGRDRLEPDEIRTMVAELEYAEFRTLCETWLRPDRSLAGITHGADSGRQQLLELAASPVRDPGARTDNALAALDSATIAPVLTALVDGGLLPLETGRLPNDIPWVHITVPGGEGDARTRFGWYRPLPPLKVQRPGDRPGIVQYYNSVVRYDETQHRNRDGRTLRIEPLPHELRPVISRGRFGVRGEAAPSRLSALGDRFVQRLESRDFNTIRWGLLVEYGAQDLREFRSRPRHVAEAWCREQLLVDDPDRGYWQPEPGRAERIRYKDLGKLHRETAGRMDGTICLFVGPGSGAAAAGAVAASFIRADDWKPVRYDPPELRALDGITGRVFLDTDRGDVLLTVAFAPVPESAGGAMADLLARETLRLALGERLREVEGLTYSVRTGAERIGGLSAWRVAVTCRPRQAPQVLDVLREVLQRVRAEGPDRDELARSRLGLAGRWITAGGDPDQARDLLFDFAAAGLLDAPPPDPVAALVDVPDTAVAARLTEVVDPDAFVFTAVGPILEETIEEYDVSVR